MDTFYPVYILEILLTMRKKEKPLLSLYRLAGKPGRYISPTLAHAQWDKEKKMISSRHCRHRRRRLCRWRTREEQHIGVSHPPPSTNVHTTVEWAEVYTLHVYIYIIIICVCTGTGGGVDTVRESGRDASCVPPMPPPTPPPHRCKRSAVPPARTVHAGETATGGTRAWCRGRVEWWPEGCSELSNSGPETFMTGAKRALRSLATRLGPAAEESERESALMTIAGGGKRDGGRGRRMNTGERGSRRAMTKGPSVPLHRWREG